MPRRAPSPYSNALICRVKATHGIDVSEPDLERWRTWRGAPLIPCRTSGTRARWRPDLAETIPAEEIDRVAEVARLVRRYRSLDVAGMILAARGELDKTAAPAVREAFVAHWTRRLHRAGDARRRARRLTRGPRPSARRSTLVLEYREALGKPVDTESLYALTVESLLAPSAATLLWQRTLDSSSAKDIWAALREAQGFAPYRRSARRAYGHHNAELDVLRIALFALRNPLPSSDQVTVAANAAPLAVDTDELDSSTVALGRRYLDLPAS